ncbi:MAG: type II toxin-antitoxin system RelB/DinJ family antitoxin [Candidatus Gastranaerophilales bacterium]|nr:type II toxin-antitoxin system RelB/DinJ family antitoxin [Candidatus Gastranaerophilales bacterium]
MSKTIQIRVDDFLKFKADELFNNLGMDTSTAIRIFLTISTEIGGLPFEVKLPNASLKEAINDVMNEKNISKPYKSARAAVESMLED